MNCQKVEPRLPNWLHLYWIETAIFRRHRSSLNLKIMTPNSISLIRAKSWCPPEADATASFTRNAASANLFGRGLIWRQHRTYYGIEARRTNFRGLFEQKTAKEGRDDAGEF